MKIGVKIYPDNISYAKKIEKFVDFYEVVIMEGKKYDFLKKLKHPFFFHSDDFKYQTNLANPDNNSASERYLKFSFDLMKQHKALGLITNPGTRFNNRCSTENLIRFFRKFGPKKIILENQPPLKNRTYPFFARNYDEVHQIMKKSGVSCCIDFDHAYASAFFFGKDPVRFCQDLLDLKPKNVHISNGRNESYIDSHLHFLEGDFNMMKMKSLIPPDVMVTIDTSNDFEIQLSEIKFLRS
ncbi:MAG: hypothetical protein ABIJ21_01195 [Nanoarchaeota archaeon]